MPAKRCLHQLQKEFLELEKIAVLGFGAAICVERGAMRCTAKLLLPPGSTSLVKN